MPILKPPPFYPVPFKSGTSRTIAIQIPGEIATEHGEVIRWPRSYIELKDAIIEHNLLLFAPVVPWPQSVVALGDSLMWSNKARRFNGARIHKGRSYAHIALSDNWPGLHNRRGMRDLRRLFDTCSVGDWPTPAGLGQALMRRYYARGSGRISRPPVACLSDLRENLIGGSSQLFRPGLWRHVVEEDVNAAYPWAMREVPAGNVHWIDHEDDPIWTNSHRYKWWFGKMKWRILGTDERVIPIPLLGVKHDSGAVDYPSEPGVWHEGWYTKDEAYAAMIHGYELKWQYGWGWTATTDAFAPWVDRIGDLRESLDGHAAAWIKQAAVASIGRFGQEPCSYRVILDGQEKELSEDTRYICDCDTGDVLYVVERIPNLHNPELLAHIAVKVHADVRIKTWTRAMPYAAEKRLIATNFDAVYYVGDPARDDLSDRIGDWKRTELWSASFPARRWLLADGVTKTPGMPHAA